MRAESKPKKTVFEVMEIAWNIKQRLLVLLVSCCSLKSEVALINQAIASISRDIGWCSVPSVIGSIFPIVVKTTLCLNFSALISIHHKAALESLLLLEGWVVILA